MKSSQIKLIILGFIFLALWATNPPLEEHKEEVKKMFLKEIEKNINNNSNNATNLAASIGSSIAEKFIDQMVSQDNYIIFSTTRYSIKNKSKIIGLGILGSVFIKDYEEIKSELNLENKIPNEDEKSSNSEEYYEIDGLQIMKDISYGTKNDAKERFFKLLKDKWRYPNRADFEKMNRYSKNIEFIQCKSYWCITPYLDLDRVDIEECEDARFAYPEGELHILFVRDK
jgi:hypothetical protein